MSNPIIIFVRGIPGSGKTYFAEALQQVLAGRPVTVMDPDRVDTSSDAYKHFSAALSEEGLDSSIHPFRWLRKTAIDAAIPGAILIWNQPFTDRGIFDRLITFLREQAHAKHDVELKVLLIEINTPPEVAWKRIISRKSAGGHGPDREIFDQRCAQYTSFKDTYEVLELDGESAIESLITTAVEHIGRLQD